MIELLGHHPNEIYWVRWRFLQRFTPQSISVEDYPMSGKKRFFYDLLYKKTGMLFIADEAQELAAFEAGIEGWTMNRDVKVIKWPQVEVVK